MKFTVKQVFDVDEETFWHKVHLSEDYNRALYEQHLKFRTFKMLELNKNADGSVVRRMELVPAVEVPAVVKKVIGDVTAYVEEGRFDPVARRFRFTANPTATDKIRVAGELWVESKGPKQVERCVEMDVTVKVFGVGKVVEGFVEQNVRQSLEKGAEFTRRWIQEQKL